MPLLRAIVAAVAATRIASSLPKIEAALRETRSLFPHLVSLWKEAEFWRPQRSVARQRAKGPPTKVCLRKPSLSPPSSSSPILTSPPPSPIKPPEQPSLPSSPTSITKSTKPPSRPSSPLLPTPPVHSSTPPSHTKPPEPPAEIALPSSPPAPAKPPTSPSPTKPPTSPSLISLPPSAPLTSSPPSPLSPSPLSPNTARIIKILNGTSSGTKAPPSPPKPIFAALGGHLAAAEAAAIARMQMACDQHQQQKTSGVKIARNGPRRARTAADRSASRPVTRSQDDSSTR